ncbi:MAG: hypothetical protein ACAI34_19025 [Verrucomicrobium sp.]
MSVSLNQLLYGTGRLLAAVAGMFLLCQCQSLKDWTVSTTPPEIPMGAPKAWVLLHMGGPDGREPWYYDPNDAAEDLHLSQCPVCEHRQPCQCGGRKSRAVPARIRPQVVGEILHYKDDMNPQGRWLSVGSAWSDPFCSWDLYFNRRDRYVGWRLVEPLSGQRGRERFVSSDYGSRVNRAWHRKVEKLLREYREHLYNRNLKVETLQEASQVVAFELAQVPREFPEQLLLQDVLQPVRQLADTPVQKLQQDGRSRVPGRAGWPLYSCLVYDAAAAVDALLREL